MAATPDHVDVIKSSEFFDAVWYRGRYPDVGQLGMNPARHYFLVGAWLGRDPGPLFDTREYLRRSPDVAATGMNPLVHYELYGRREQRPIGRASAGNSPTWDLAGQEPEVLERLRDAFDAPFYLASNPDVAASGEDPLTHYMRVGWLLGRDPSPSFSTDYYLEHSPDIKTAGMNPFLHYVLHGIREKRATEPYQRWLSRIDYQPSVTAIVPNYNHARYLRERIDSILAQTYPHLEVLLLDDASTDESREVIAEYCEQYPDRVRAIVNEQNSGNVFKQWRRGLEATKTELVWICESDDFCEPDFLENLVPHFRRRSVQIAFGRIQFAEEDGTFRRGLDGYREGAEPGIWDQPVTRPAARWFAGGFGVNNVIPNVGGCVWRNQTLTTEIWEEAQTYTILGDWFLYLQLAGGGDIAYEPSATAFFRQHGENTSVASFTGAPYYREHASLMTAVRRRWDVPQSTVQQFFGKLAFQYEHFELEPSLGPLEQYVDPATLASVERVTPHVLVAFLGFHPGGGETFPIALANALHRQGWLVSMIAFDLSTVNEQMARSLSASIPVYSCRQIAETGVDRFMADAGVSLVHSHMVSLDNFFLEKHKLDPRIPYVVSMHGSYEGSGLSPERIRALAQRVDHWAYLTERNLVPLGGAVPEERLTKFPNGMPADPRPFAKSRADLDIDDDAIVFAFVARGIPEKGWEIVGDAFAQLRNSVDTRVHLILCGDGLEAERAEARWGEDPDMTFMGFQAEINGLYRMSDCALVPTRFHGESSPLCVIQALQEGLPVVATDIGEISAMITSDDGERSGLLVPEHDDDATFAAALVDAMREMLDKQQRERMASVAAGRGRRFGIESVASLYSDLYERLLHETRR